MNESKNSDDEWNDEIELPHDYWTSFVRPRSRIFFNGGPNIGGVGFVVNGRLSTVYGNIIRWEGFGDVRGFYQSVRNNQVRFILDVRSNVLILYKIRSENPLRYAFRITIPDIDYENVENLLNEEELSIPEIMQPYAQKLLNQPKTAPAASCIIKKRRHT